MRIELDFNNREHLVEAIEMAESCGLSLCPRCVKAFTSGGLCGSCEDIARVTAKRINVGLAEHYAYRRKWLIAAGVAQTAFWIGVIVLLIRHWGSR
jgi:hypothetical protein